MKPTPRKPNIIIAQVEGSGTAAVKGPDPTGPVLPLVLAISAAKRTLGFPPVLSAKLAALSVPASVIVNSRNCVVNCNPVYWMAFVKFPKPSSGFVLAPTAKPANIEAAETTGAPRPTGLKTNVSFELPV